MAEIINFSKFKDPSSLTVEEVLHKADGKYESVLVIGWSKEPSILQWDISKNMTRESALYLLEQYKRILLSY